MEEVAAWERMSSRPGLVPAAKTSMAMSVKLHGSMVRERSSLIWLLAKERRGGMRR